jgi:hypothetical protein
MDQISTIRLDLAKNIFKVHGIDACGKVVVRKPLLLIPRRTEPAQFCVESNVSAANSPPFLLRLRPRDKLLHR